MDIVLLVFRFEVKQDIRCLSVMADHKRGIGTKDYLCDFCVGYLQNIGAGWRAFKVRTRVESLVPGCLGTVIRAIRQRCVCHRDKDITQIEIRAASDHKVVGIKPKTI